MADVGGLKKELTDIKTKLGGLKASAKDVSEIAPLQEALAKIDNLRVDGKFVDAKGEIPAGQAELHDLLAECYEIKEAIYERIGN